MKYDKLKEEVKKILDEIDKESHIKEVREHRRVRGYEICRKWIENPIGYGDAINAFNHFKMLIETESLNQSEIKVIECYIHNAIWQYSPKFREEEQNKTFHGRLKLWWKYLTTEHHEDNNTTKR